MSGKKVFLSLVLLPAIFLSFFSGCKPVDPQNPDNTGSGQVLRDKNQQSELATFASCGEMKDYIDERVAENGTRYSYAEGSMKGAIAPTGAIMAVSDNAVSSATGASSDYSTTNIQVAGVDEADIIKNDGKYVYLVKGNTVRIIQAYPPNQMKELDTVKFDEKGFMPQEMYVDGDVLVVIGRSYGGIIRPMDSEYKTMYEPYRNSSATDIYILNIEDRNDSEVERNVSFEGDYVSSRKIEDTVYLITNKYAYEYYPVPLYKDSAEESSMPVAKCSDVSYFPHSQATNYMVVAGISTKDYDKEISREVVVGSSENVYSSTKNLYVAETEYQGYDRGIIRDSSNDEEKTNVYKFSLDPDEVKYEGSGEVPGHILNQFSMDENDNYFRIATTIGEVWDSKNKATNNLYVLDDGMEVVGKIEEIAPGEKIYSVRFMGDRAYMVTFKKVDPLFVIDLKDPENPKILGKLKIPGYSDYLHPYDENHIIGFGKDALDASEQEVNQRDLDFAWYQGMKVAMFDVTDVENPKELFKVVIGDRGTESPLLYDHKALLFDKEKGFMAFPVTLHELPEDVKDDPKTPDNTYGDPVYQGAYIYDIDLKDGFTLRGRVTHYDEKEIEKKAGYYWYGDRDISRILYIGDYFYTVSQAVVQANDMDNLKEKGSVELDPGEEVYRGGDIMY